ncbi:uncharacterized protein EDB93DRAFT_1164046 [Suillus bovinus]|uniref:uncharacterized protein n=1 Tax=Suillus bovinus TaxID=48563 RepID=UPI001B85C6FD|nr:uncharacterized protein EDB93DRAFT_1164046 [Suillus bovinus]KAG2139082.1 hypothetical protein EDB93DRAFT_1164046 [Suillus bovinus]
MMDRSRANRRQRRERTISSSRLTLRSPLSSGSGQALDQHSIRLALQSGLKHLDRFEHHVHEETKKIRSLFINLLDNCQSDVTTESSSRHDSVVDSQSGLDDLDDIELSLSGSPKGLFPHGTRSFVDHVTATWPQHSMYSEGLLACYDPRVTRSSSDVVDPHLDVSLHRTSDSVHAPTAQPFENVYFGEHVTLSSSARPGVQLSMPVVQDSQAKEKVQCTWDGCWAFVNKDNLTRHIEEVHEERIKAVCTGCGRKFKRQYQVNEHILRTGCGIWA